MAKTTIQWQEGMNFKGTDSDGRTVSISGGPGEGVSPMQMLLLALGSCASVDVLSILQKQRQPLRDLRVEVDGQRGEDYPRPYESIHMKFTIFGQGVEPDKIKRAIELSTEKYCGVHGTLRGVAAITWEFEVKD